MLRFVKTFVMCGIVLGGSCAFGADVAEQVKQIRDLLQDNKADEAEQAFQNAIGADPESIELALLRPQLFSALARAGKMGPAAEHAVAHQARQFKLFKEGKLAPAALMQATSMASMALQRNGAADRAVELTRESLTAADQRASVEDFAELGTARGELRMSLASLLTRQGKRGEALELMGREVQEATTAQQADIADADRAVRLIRATDLQLNLQALEGEVDQTEARTAQRKFVRDQLQQHPSNPQLISIFVSSKSLQIRELAQTKPDEADTLVSELRTELTELKDREGAPKAVLDNALRGVNSLQQMIAAERKRLALIGKPAFPLDVESWANGEAIAEGGLSGKVVLLDFWAVWCGPCIATFPHLREWHEKYGPQGFEIVGVTQYYEYGWDGETNRPQRVAEISAADERKAMEQFAAYHQLKHRIAITPKGSQFQQEYGVTGIPQAVLIDRKGVVRMIRVGSGDKNAHDLDAQIQELLKE